MHAYNVIELHQRIVLHNSNIYKIRTAQMHKSATNIKSNQKSSPTSSHHTIPC